MLNVITSILVRTIVAGTPLLLGTLGEVTAERSGIMNLGVEGMMSIGAVTGFIVTFTTGNPWLGMVAAACAGALFSLIHGFVTISLRANQVVSGLSLTMLGLGLSGLWGKTFIGHPLETRMTPIEIPLLSEIPVVGKVLFFQDAYFYLSVILGLIVWFTLKYTRVGIIVRSVGENPKAAEAQGINVAKVKYICVMIGGAFAGLGGAHLSTAYSKSWIEGMVSGRGWIVIALTIFARWEPSRSFLGAYIFGGIFVLQFVLQPLGISPNLLAMLPYLTTMLVLLGYGMSKKGQRSMSAPATLGEPYIRGGR
jgi:general nucleoside transport system permease protein